MSDAPEAAQDARREAAYAVLQRHLGKQGFGGSTVKSGYFRRRDQLCVDAMIEFAAKGETESPLTELARLGQEFDAAGEAE